MASPVRGRHGGGDVLGLPWGAYQGLGDGLGEVAEGGVASGGEFADVGVGHAGECRYGGGYGEGDDVGVVVGGAAVVAGWLKVWWRKRSSSWVGKPSYSLVRRSRTGSSPCCGSAPPPSHRAP